MDRDEFLTVIDLVRSERAAIKLMLINHGVRIEGDLQALLPGYPDNYRTKRRSKQPILRDGAVIDAETRDLPWIPEEFYITVQGRESVVKTNHNPKSPFSLEIRNDQPVIHCPILNLQIPCRLPARPDIHAHPIDDYPADNFVQLIGADRLAVLGFEGCSGWHEKNSCLFCDSCVSRPGELRGRPNLNALYNDHGRRIEEWLQASEAEFFPRLRKSFQLALDHKLCQPHRHLMVLSGNLPDMAAAWRYILRLSRVLADIEPLANFDSCLNMLPPPNAEFLEQAREIGYRNLLFNLEVFGETDYRRVCPGKSGLVPYSQFIHALQRAAKLFGAGHSRCGFVLGAQPLETLKPGVEQLSDQGIACDFTIFTPKAGTPWAEESRPDMVEVARFSRFLADTCKRHGFQPLYCSLSSRSSVCNECFED